MPPGSLTKLLVAAQVRGTHSTGIAWFNRGCDRYSFYKNAVPAEKFVVDDNLNVALAETASFGIAHCRNASPKMPVNTDNAHPFVWHKLIYAHNGAVKNWHTLRASLFNTEEGEKVTTDSMVLGPLLEYNDLSLARGSFGLVWLDKSKCWMARSAKELTAIHLTWTINGQHGKVTLAGSTLDILLKGFDHVPEATWFEYEVKEGHKYELTEEALLVHGPIKINEANATDAHSSGSVVWKKLNSQI